VVKCRQKDFYQTEESIITAVFSVREDCDIDFACGDHTESYACPEKRGMNCRRAKNMPHGTITGSLHEKQKKKERETV